MTRLLAVAVLVAAVAACGDPRASHYLSAEPDPAELVGRYEEDDGWSVLPAETAATRDPGRPSGLVLHADGTFDATALPGRESLQSNDAPPLVIADGAWRIARTGSVDRGNGLEPIWSVTFDSDPPLEHAMVLDPAPPHRLVVVLGDPDEGLGLALRRVN